MDSAGVNQWQAAYRELRVRLMAERNAEGYWLGQLSPSALSTATAVCALTLARTARDTHQAWQFPARRDGARELHSALIDRAARWLCDHQNADGGWGDTPDSPSNLPTTLLVCAALSLAGVPTVTSPPLSPPCLPALERAESYVAARAGPTTQGLVAAVTAAYGDDRTFAVPILVTCALAGRCDWRVIPGLPFELAVIPHRWLRLMRAHVVSYALPALVAIGQLIHAKRPAPWPWRAVRDAAIQPTLRKLAAIQPATGGFLEAVPLTSFVVMSLVAAGRVDHAVVTAGLRFLEGLARPDGSWPIDANLSVWGTTRAVEALGPADVEDTDELRTTLEWLLARQHKASHPFTQSAPGGWAWTHLPGGVPDVDDTSGALLALRTLWRRIGGGPLEGDDLGRRVRESAVRGVKWLLDLQNADGGWPTFCRGWGRLPFDRSSPDLTAHALRAMNAWRASAHAARVDRATVRGLAYLARTQRPEGSWLPLWFGNQAAPDLANPVYGTSRALAVYRDLGRIQDLQPARGVRYLVSAQNRDAGWGGGAGLPSTVEETALAVEVLSAWMGQDEVRQACSRGAGFLAEAVRGGALEKPSPIGLYFTTLWYSERLYPIVWSLSALGRVIEKLG